MKKKTMVDTICSVAVPSRGWLERLSAEDRKTAEDVKKMVNAESLPKIPVARNLIEALGLTVSEKAVFEWFRKKETSS